MAKADDLRWQNWTALGRPHNTFGPPPPPPHRCEQCTLGFWIVLDRDTVCPDCHVSALRGEPLREALARLRRLDWSEADRVEAKRRQFRAMRIQAVREQITTPPDTRTRPATGAASRAVQLVRRARLANATALDESMRRRR